MGTPIAPHIMDAPVARDNTSDTITATATLTADQTDVICTIPLADADSVTLTLPPVGQMRGKTVQVHFIRASGEYVDGEGALQDNDDGLTAQSFTAFTNAGDWIAVYSTGKQWIPLGWVKAGTQWPSQS